MTLAHESHHEPSTSLPVHRHAESYAALVLDGGYEELTLDGRFDCVPGMLVIHPAWHAHGDAFGRGGAVVLNLPAPLADGFCAIRVVNAAALEILARRNPQAAAEAACEEAETVRPKAPADWLIELTRLMIKYPGERIDTLAARCGVSAEHAARACKRWFGMGPVDLRKERRLQTAIALLRAGASPADAALAAGFADQPHLTRLLKQATGHTPARFPLN
ncbi:helix-turn-helix domain-containing protein [Hyphobacterium sp.]|uniref:helix-turn-helix domain-containing protein n=1 Tax=Hyphobacterium sp. TaxID=2004662 RepID=UPI003B52A489